MARRVLHDRYFKQAKAEGYFARSAYKLLEIQEKKHILRAGDRVLDLGCAPGSWMQVAAKLVGTSGVVVGIDLQEVREHIAPNVFTLQADAFATQSETLLGSSGKRFDVVLSDMAPSTSGHGDDLLSVRLCRRVLTLCEVVLRPGGNLCMKVLEGEQCPDLIRETRALFVQAGTTKPAASREVSREIFIWAIGYKALGAAKA